MRDFEYIDLSCIFVLNGKFAAESPKMSDFPTNQSIPPENQTPGDIYGYGPYPMLALRSILGGVCTGLASVVPGVSGGTMLAATGIYPFVLEAIAEGSRWRWTRRNVFVLSIVVLSALVSVFLLAEEVRSTIIAHRYLMFSFFAGLTCGGIPVLYAMIQPLTKHSKSTILISFMIAASLTLLNELTDIATYPHFGPLWFFIGGLFAASSTLLPGVSGAYLLVLLGIHIPLIDALTLVREGYQNGHLLDGLINSASVLIPTGLGAIVGLLFFSHIFRRLLITKPQITLGTLLGLVLGSTIGLWPFQRTVPPEVGEVFQGRIMSAEMIAQLPAHLYPVEYFKPSGLELVSGASIFFLGFLLTALVTKFSSTGDSGIDTVSRTYE